MKVYILGYYSGQGEPLNVIYSRKSIAHGAEGIAYFFLMVLYALCAMPHAAHTGGLEAEVKRFFLMFVEETHRGQRN